MESFPKGALCIDRLFGLVHTNVWGLSKTPPLNKAKYLYLFQMISLENHSFTP
jgi:hypothetical protein